MVVIAHDELVRLLDNLAREKKLIAPTEAEGVLLYRPVQSSAEIVWDFSRPVISIKEALFPGTERLLTIEEVANSQDGSKLQFTLTETLPDVEQIVYGVRPCDAQGLKVLDALFLKTEPMDVYYSKRRQNTTLIGLACKEMEPTCFCTSMGGAPDDTQNMDLMLFEVEEGYLAQVVTEKGQVLLEGLSLKETSSNPLKPELHSIQKIPSSEDWLTHFDDEYWDCMAERCLSCRICSYVCPTCRCFDVRDEVLPLSENGHNRYERIRCWDSCAGEVYRKIAGGHNPRQAKGQRMRNRFQCKFYYYPLQYGPVACTGCGRCIDACPVNIDITEVLEHIASEQGDKSK
jgi:sulfhydrogenase subunit beta (sulfur reductase)